MKGEGGSGESLAYNLIARGRAFLMVVLTLLLIVTSIV